MMSKMTPGPWIQDKSDLRFIYALNRAGVNRFYLHVQAGWDDTLERTHVAELEETARAIAALPDLVEALKSCQGTLLMLTEPEAIRSTLVHQAWAAAVEAELKARAALAKAGITEEGK
jgi:hypothetical protein